MTIAQIKERLSIGEVLSHYGLQANRNKMLSCPFHDDKTPSMQVYPDTNTVYCFSSNCKHGGKAIDQIDFIMLSEGSSKHQAILQAKSLIPGHVTTSKSQTMTHNPSSPPQELDVIFTKLRQTLHRSKSGLAYLKGRGLDPVRLPIGYNHYRTDYAHLRNCVIFALKDQTDQIVSLYGRSVTATNNNKHYYTKNRRGLYPGYPATDTQTLIITEAIVDAATLQTHTDHPVLSLYGTNGWNEEHTAAIKRLSNLEEVIFFLDGDEAGHQAIQTYAPLVKAMCTGIKISQVRTPDGEDANSLAQNHPGQESQILNHLIDSRTFLFSPEKSSRTSESPSDENKKTQLSKLSTLDTTNPEYITMQTDQMHFTIIGGIGLYPLDRMKVTLKIQKADSTNWMHRLRQTVDLYQDDTVEKLARKVAERLEIGSTKVHQALLQLTELAEDHRLSQIENQKAKKPPKRILTQAQRRKATVFLQSKNLLKRTNQAIGKAGVVGEQNNRLLMYLVFTSRLREQPLHIVSLGSSGTGKTYLQEKVAALIPEDQKLEITAISENAFYYFDRTELKNKLVLIEDLDGASDDKVLFAVRELQSKRRISKTIPIKDSKGNLKTITLQVEGPISLAGTTTRERLYEDNANRSLLIYLDSSKDHKEKIMAYQRQVSAGKINQTEEAQMREFMQDVQSVLRPIRVINPFAEMLTIPQSVFKPLRTNSHYLHFIETVTFYHQCQREIKYQNGQAYIETTIEDIQAANQLLKDVLLAKSDELTKASRRFLDLLKIYLAREKRDSFYSSQVRKAYRMSPATVKRQLLTLVRYGYVKVAGGSRSKGYEYELVAQAESLRENVESALDQALNRVKEWLSGSPVAQNAKRATKTAVPQVVK